MFINTTALIAAFNALGNALADLHLRAETEATQAAPTDPREVAAILNDLIAGLRTIFPATDTWRQVGEIAETEVIPALRERMANPSSDN